MTRERFTITIESVPGRDTPAIIRLRGALKCLLRAFGLRCVGLSQPREPGIIPSSDETTPGHERSRRDGRC